MEAFGVGVFQSEADAHALLQKVGLKECTYVLLERDNITLDRAPFYILLVKNGRIVKLPIKKVTILYI